MITLFSQPKLVVGSFVFGGTVQEKNENLMLDTKCLFTCGYIHGKYLDTYVT